MQVKINNLFTTFFSRCLQYKYVSIDSYPYRGLYSVDSIDSNRLVDLDSIKEFNHTYKKPLLAAKLSSGEVS